MTRPAMTPEDIERVANAIRATLQMDTCCPGHASQVCLMVLAGFALEDVGHDRFRAAENIRRAIPTFAAAIERGDFTVMRRQ